MVDTKFFRICVFSYDGKLIRSWRELWKSIWRFNYSWGITIYQEVIFVSDLRNIRIQAFTRHGKFILGLNILVAVIYQILSLSMVMLMLMIGLIII